MDDIKVNISIESKLGQLPLLRKMIRGICSCVIDNEQIFQDIDLSLNEAISNVIYHAYHNEPGHEIQIKVSLYPEEVIFQIIDIGSKNLNTEIPALPQIDFDNTEALPESGRGLFIIHQLMDEVSYKSEKNQNILLLRKRFK